MLPYTYVAQFATGGINFLYLEDSGLTVAGDGFTASGSQQMSDGSTFVMLTRGALQPGETARVTLSGQPTVSVAGQTETSTARRASLFQAARSLMEN